MGKVLSFKIESIKGSEGVIKKKRGEVYILKMEKKLRSLHSQFTCFCLDW